MLKQKPIKKKPTCGKDKENLYSEKINKRKISANKSLIIRSNKDDEEDSDELSEESDYDMNKSDVYSVKVKKSARQEKKLKLKNGKLFVTYLLIVLY